MLRDLKQKKFNWKTLFSWMFLIFLFIMEVFLFLTKTNILILDFLFWASFVSFYIIRFKNGKNMKKEILDLPLLIPLFLIDNQNIVLGLRFLIIICMYFDYFIDIALNIILSNRILLIVISVISLQFIGGIGLMVFENLSFKDAEWLTFITSTTIGYGDMYAITDLGRIITMVIAIFGGVVYGALVITGIMDGVDYLRKKEFEEKLKNDLDKEDISIVYSAFDRFSHGEITINEVKEIVVQELAKKDN